MMVGTDVDLKPSSTLANHTHENANAAMTLKATVTSAKHGSAQGIFTAE